MNRRINILGAGGHACSIINLLELNNFLICGIFDDSYDPNKTELISSFQLKGNFSDLVSNYKSVLAIGDNRKRELLYNKFGHRIYQPNVVHPTAIIERGVATGNSNFIFANVYLNTKVSIGKNNIINSGSIIEHESQIGSHNHISVGSIISGRVSIGNGCFIGVGAVIIDKIKICDSVIVGANSVVIDDIVDSGVYVGNPARKIK